MQPIVYAEMKAGEAASVCALAQQVFDEWVAPDCTREGKAEFSRFANSSAMAKRMCAGGFVLVARQGGNLVGVLEFAPPDRMALLFVTLRRQGIARELLRHAIEKARAINPSLAKVTVHASPYAQTAYRRMGFRECGESTTDHGIRYIPMELPLSTAPSD